MLVTAADRVDLGGDLTEFVLTWAGEPITTGLPVAFNQANHLRAQQQGPSAWLAGTVRLPDSTPDQTRLVELITRILGEHDALRARFRFADTAGTPCQDVFDSAQLQVTPHHEGRVAHEYTESLIADRCHAGDAPGLFFALLDNTLVCALDHAHADAATIDMLLRRAVQLYRDPQSPAIATRSFADRCVAEDGGTSVLACDEAGTATASPDDLMQVWRDFFARTGGELPTFPLDLGADRAPQRTVVLHVIDEADIETVLGERPFATLLATLATTVAENGGPHQLATLIPIHTRGPRDSGWHETAGWMVSNAPVIVEAGDPTSAQMWLRHAAQLSVLPLESVLAECRPRFGSADIFMVSYLDYRKMGPPLPDAHHISAVTSTDTAQLWFSRTASGIDLRVRYPSLPEADAVMTRVLDDFGRHLGSGHIVGQTSAGDSKQTAAQIISSQGQSPSARAAG